jgi:hypothetical protein
MPLTSKKPPVSNILTPEGPLRSRSAIAVRAAPPKAETILSVVPTFIVLVPVAGGMALVSASMFVLVVKSVVSMVNRLKFPSLSGIVKITCSRCLKGENSSQGIIKNRFSAFYFFAERIRPCRGLGSPLPCKCKCVPTYPQQVLPSAYFGHDKNDSGDHKDHHEKAGIKTRTKNITYQFATGQREQHQQYATKY